MVTGTESRWQNSFMKVDGIKSGAVVISDAATYTVLAVNSGKPHILPNLTADITISLPTPTTGLEDGLSYEFWYAGAAADAQDWAIDAGSNTNYFLGGVLHIDSDANSAGDEAVPVRSDGNSNSILNILVPDVGTLVKIVTDGTNWYVTGQSVAATAPTFADQA